MTKSPRQLKLLAIDPGSVRLGFAVWNPAAQLSRALPVWTRKGLKNDLNFIGELIGQNEIEAFLVGLPISLGGHETPSTENARFWIEKLESEFALPVYTQDESLSSKEAEKLLKATKTRSKKTKLDSVAAAIFLEEFIREQS
ncbi:MAG: Holliday junction resolvase RuvX [Deltaproteobacteria bacterium CG11_big_fil_rev_8_21_14_0_20_45_16]|nr:MAG: Holliday junction resolvase RuvX [Deltaproteobacteria bacterium CG11_big_fil_rev_8_21_14_0_20_45_16]